MKKTSFSIALSTSLLFGVLASCQTTSPGMNSMTGVAPLTNANTAQSAAQQPTITGPATAREHAEALLRIHSTLPTQFTRPEAGFQITAAQNNPKSNGKGNPKDDQAADTVNSNGQGAGWGVCDNNGKGNGKGVDGNEGQGLGNGCTPEASPTPSTNPTATPTPDPTVAPTVAPSPAPSPTPTPDPTAVPTTNPTVTPTTAPTTEPTTEPSPPLCERRTVSAQTPTAPVFLMKEDFRSLNDPAFGNDITQPFSHWVQWGTDYYTTGNGVAPWNPGPTLGDRNQYQEYTTERPDLLETGIYKRISLVDAEGNYTYAPGDKIVAKMEATPAFTDQNSDADIGLILYNECTGETVSAYGRPLRGPRAANHEIYVEIEIPAGMTELSVSILGYLGYEEAGSVEFHNVSVEQIPQNAYNVQSLYSQSFAQGGDFGFGPNSPDVDEEFGYDFYLVPLNPTSNNLAVTAYNDGINGRIGGLVKRVELGNYAPNALLTAKMFTATTLSAGPENSFAQLALEFYDANDQRLDSRYSSTLTANHYETLIIDRSPIPAGSRYVKIVPLLSLDAQEQSSALFDDLSLEMLTP